jgi:deoxyribonucleoside regulator
VRNTLQKLQVEDELRQRFGLRDVRLADNVNCSQQETHRLIASEAAAYFDKSIRSNMKIGVTWGRTLSSMVDQLTINRTIQNLTVYTLVGNTADSPDFQPNILAQKLLQKFNGSLKTIAAPFMCGSAQLCAEMKREPQIANILSGVRDLDITIVGIGEAPVPGSKKLSDYPFDEAIINELVQSGAVGDICGNFFDIDGRVCSTTIKDRIVSIDITELPQHKMVVGVGGGSNKTQSILGALNGSYLDVLITDLETARSVLALDAKHSDVDAPQ